MISCCVTTLERFCSGKQKQLPKNGGLYCTGLGQMSPIVGQLFCFHFSVLFSEKMLIWRWSSIAQYPPSLHFGPRNSSSCDKPHLLFIQWFFQWEREGPLILLHLSENVLPLPLQVMFIAYTCGIRNAYRSISSRNPEAPDIDRHYGHNARVIIIRLANLVISQEYKVFWMKTYIMQEWIWVKTSS